jgi:uncharacterized membrane protein
MLIITIGLVIFCVLKFFYIGLFFIPFFGICLIALFLNLWMDANGYSDDVKYSKYKR